MDSLKYLVFGTALLGSALIFIFRKSLPTIFKWVGLFLFFAGTSQIIGYLIAIHYRNNVAYYHIVLIINSALLFIILSKMLSDKSYQRKLAAVFIIGAIGIIYFISLSFSSGFASRGLTILNIIVPVGCLLYLYEILKIPVEVPLIHQGKFWIASALLVHHFSSFTLWIAYELNFTLKGKYMFEEISAALNILLYIMLSTAGIVELNFQKYGGSKRR